MCKPLLERDEALLTLAREPSVIVRGPAGIGKTSLLEAARAAWEGPVLSATGLRLQRDQPFAVVVALVEGALTPARREVAGAGLCALVDGDLGLGGLGPADAALSITHGLRRLLAGLGEPHLLMLDDAHWADTASREALAVAAPGFVAAGGRIVLATRSSPPERLTPHAAIVEPQPLSRAAVDDLAGSGGELFARTGGNPFLVMQLLAHRRRGAVLPSGITAVVGEQLEDLGSDATALARAVAVAGGEMPLHVAAAVARLELDAAAAAADALAAADILRPGVPLRFTHALIADATLELLGAAARGLLERRAAAALAEAGAPAAAVGARLLAAPVAAEPWAANALFDAGVEALEHGDPSTAARLLRRAREEAPADPRIALPLARAAAYAGTDDAERLLGLALGNGPEPPLATLVLLETGDALASGGRTGPALAVLSRALTSARDPAVGDDLRAWAILAAATAAWTHRTALALRRPHPGPDDGPLARAAIELTHAAADSLAGASSHATAARASAALARLTGVPRLAGAFLAFMALVPDDRLDELDALTADGLTWAGQVGSALADATWLNARTLLAAARGRLEDAIRDGHAALDAGGWGRNGPVLRAALADAHLERGERDAATAVVGGDLERWRGRVDTHALLVARARLEAPERAIELLREAGRCALEAGVLTPAWAPWRGALAIALLDSDAGEADALAAEELALAEAAGGARAIGVALRALGLVRRDEALLRDAVARLEPTLARLELARAELTLGVVLRRAGRRSEARAPLRAALRDAHGCGATVLAERAHLELKAVGGRRRAGAGRDELTPAELRVARLAAAGASNPEIARELFVGRRTVEMHLSRTYRKLGIDGRDGLARALR